MFCLHVLSMQQCMPVAIMVRRWCQIPWDGVTNGCEPLCGYWDLNPIPLQEEVFLITKTSFYPCHEKP